jgi:ectoine hydroxylase-related dioxygenase (phytanoyl-CoA dioxygenase family)
MKSGIPGNLMKPFREIYASDLQSHSLKNEMNSQGYPLMRGLLPLEDVSQLLDEILQIVQPAEWLMPGSKLSERIANDNAKCGDSDSSFNLVYEQVFRLESFHALAHHPALREVMNLLVGPRLLIHPKPIGRLIFPNCERFVIHAHQDHQSIAGDPESFTAWMPLHDCPVELGPLRILEGSHHFGLQDIDPQTGIIPEDTARGAVWVGGQINAGDVLIFHSLTVHAASPNTSQQLRISMDCRFQDSERALDPANLVFPGSSNRSWETTYANWRFDGLKYFWKDMALRFEPSKSELANLVQTADSSKMRSRYARILSQLELQIPR